METSSLEQAEAFKQANKIYESLKKDIEENHNLDMSEGIENLAIEITKDIMIQYGLTITDERLKYIKNIIIENGKN